MARNSQAVTPERVTVTVTVLLSCEQLGRLLYALGSQGPRVAALTALFCRVTDRENIGSCLDQVSQRFS
jgi:hypothetical protein